MADAGKTYQDLMQLLPEVSFISVGWERDEDGIPRGVSQVALTDHDGELLISIDADQVDRLPAFILEQLNADQLDLLARMPAVVQILEWLDPFELEEDGHGGSVIALPSPLHVPDELPVSWIQQDQ